MFQNSYIKAYIWLFSAFLLNILYLYFRCYTDRKKKIIREWSKNNSSPRPPEGLAPGGDPLRAAHPYMGDFLTHPGYPNPYGVKDEPLRPDYYTAYAAYGEGKKFYFLDSSFKLAQTWSIRTLIPKLSMHGLIL